jgi:hypothetical protein
MQINKYIKVGSITLGIFFLILILALSFENNCRSSVPNFVPIKGTLTEQETNQINSTSKYKRPIASTYLSFPEWYLVFNPQEYAAYLKEGRPSRFPYFGSIKQFWGGYCKVYGVAKRNFPPNSGSHITDIVVGTSFSLEYAVKGVYENTVGRISEWSSSYHLTQEDHFAAKVAEDYGNFIPTQPWYDFPFGQKLVGLWKDTSFWGKYPIRKFERKSILSLEYSIKSLYAIVIRTATHLTFGAPDTKVYASVSNASEVIFRVPEVHKIKEMGAQKYILTVPHYQGFTEVVPKLANLGVRFEDIAGNQEIFMTAIAPANYNFDLPNGSLIFTQNLLTDNSQKRIAVQVPVKSLTEILKAFKIRGLVLEHLYDY